MRRIAAGSLALALAGCGTPGTVVTPLVPDKTIQFTSQFAASTAGLAGAAAAATAIYLIYDPLAPNWEIDESRPDDDTVRLSLRMKRYQTGGAGESIQIVKRRALQLQNELGYGSYRLAEFNEGIESETLGARRVATGVVKLVNRRAADSFLQNDAN